MSAIEIVATLLGLTNVTLIVRRNIWNFPFGLAMVALYAKIFYDHKLYSDALLQIFFFAIQLYGWWYWLKGRADNGLIRVELLDQAWRLAALAAIAIGSALLGWVMASHSDAAVPYWDATTTVMSVVATLLMCRRKIENWVLWIAVDVLAIGIYSYKELYLTAGLYAVFLGLATWGLVSWKKAYRDGTGAPAATRVPEGQ
ncbi:MAG: nicotinamide riboside transporter PnuC [Pseudomonadota bacterium]